MPYNLIKVPNKVGVYYLESTVKRHNGKPDKCYYISYKNPVKKVVKEKIGWLSEGYSAQVALHVRGERTRKVRHGKELPSTKKQSQPTFGDAWDRYDEWLDTGKKHVAMDRSRYENHIKVRFQSKLLGEINTGDLEKFKQVLMNKGLAPASVKHVLVVIRQVYNKAKLWGLWDGTNPVTGVKFPKINNRRERFLKHKEAYILLEKLKPVSLQLHRIAKLSLHTGMRASEIFNLQWGHIDLDNNFILIADPKGNPARKVIMPGIINKMLTSMEMGRPEEYVFKQTYKGTKVIGNKPIKQISSSYFKTVKKLGFNDGITDRRQKVTFHTLRHTFASWLAIQGTPILEIKELLGHATLAMTERYAHLIPDQKRTSVEKMEKAFKDAIDDQKDENPSKFK